MYTTYDNLTLGTISGVRKKLSSPEVGLALQSVNDRRLSYSVNTTSNVFTTAVNHGFNNNEQIGFETSGTLPAPLTTLTPYYIINQTPTTFQIALSVAGTAVDITTAGTGTNTVYRNFIDLKINTALTDTKATTLKNHLLVWLRDVNPDTIEKWTALRSAHFVKFRPRVNMDKFPIYGMFAYGNTEFSNIWVIQGADGLGLPMTAMHVEPKPKTYYTDILPTNGAGGTLEGIASYGDRLIYSSTDNVANRLYINRKSNDTILNPEPVWDRANYYDGLDYLMNPEVLNQSHEYLAISRLFTLGVFQNKPGETSPDTVNYLYKGEEFWHNKFIGALYGERDQFGRTVIPGVIKLLRVNFSNDGDFGDFEREMAGDEHYGFV